MLGRLVSATGVLLVTWLATLSVSQSAIPDSPQVGEFVGQVARQVLSISQNWYREPESLLQQWVLQTGQVNAPEPAAQIQEDGSIETLDEQRYVIEQNITRTIIQPTNTVTNTTTETVREENRALVDILPSSDGGGLVYKSGSEWKSSRTLYHGGDKIGIGTTSPASLLHVYASSISSVPVVIQGRSGQTAKLTEWRNSSGDAVASINAEGVLRIETNVVGNLVQLVPTGNTGSLSSSGGAFYIDNSLNPGAGFLIFSNAGAEAEGNLINVKTNNTAFSQASIYVEHRGASNAVEITHNGSDNSSNALSITNNNTQDSALGVIGYETGRGTVKITHNGSSSTPNASGLSIDVKGEGTAAQGIYVDSTGTTTIGAAGTNTTFKKIGNTTGDEFFVGTNGAFRVQRSATDSEAFRVQVNGDTQGRWLGTSDGKLKWGPGNATQDVTLERISANVLQLTGRSVITNPTANTDSLSITSSTSGNQIFRIVETGGSAGWMDINDAASVSRIRFRGDNGNNYLNVTGNFGIGTNVFDATATRTISLGAGTAPGGAISNAIQLYAIETTDDDHAGTSAELYVMDEAGNATNLSPHNFSVVPGGASEEMAWAYYSERGNLVVNADMMRALRVLESYSGEQLVYIKDKQTGVYQEWSSDVSARGVTQSELTETLSEYLTLSEWERAFLLAANELTIVQNTVFQAAVRFTAPVQFLARVRFGGAVEVSAQTAGSIEIPSGATRVAVQFPQPYGSVPRVWLTPHASVQGSMWVENASVQGFEVVLSQAQAQSIRVEWLALLNTGEGGSTTVLESVPASPSPAPTASPATASPAPESSPLPTTQPTTEPEPTVTPEPSPVLESESLDSTPIATQSSE